jgi:hypothetical protein
MSHSVLARVYNPKVDPTDKKSEPPYVWTEYENVTHCEAARLHAETYPFKNQIIETCWGDKSDSIIFQHKVTMKVSHNVIPLREILR